MFFSPQNSKPGRVLNPAHARLEFMKIASALARLSNKQLATDFKESVKTWDKGLAVEKLALKPENKFDRDITDKLVSEFKDFCFSDKSTPQKISSQSKSFLRKK